MFLSPLTSNDMPKFSSRILAAAADNLGWGLGSFAGRVVVANETRTHIGLGGIWWCTGAAHNFLSIETLMQWHDVLGAVLLAPVVAALTDNQREVRSCRQNVLSHPTRPSSEVVLILCTLVQFQDLQTRKKAYAVVPSSICTLLEITLYDTRT